jgi:hypothetical protein
VTGYGGQDSYRYSSCDGSTRMPARYGGVGVDIRYHPEHAGAPRAEVQPAPDSDPADVESAPHGFAASAAVATEYVSARVSECDGYYCGTSPVGSRVEGLRHGERATIGYDWRYFGIHGGVNLHTPLEPNRIGGFGQSGFPEFLLRFGRLDVVRFEAGLGSYNAPTLLRPGAFLGLGFATHNGWDFVWHYGMHWVAPGKDEEGNPRLDLALRAPVSDTWRIGAGLALSTGQQLLPEGRLTLAASF